MNPSRAEDCLKHCGPVSARLAEVYDDDEMLQSALATLLQGFEYPDHLHLTLEQVRKRYFDHPLPVAG